MSNINKEFCYEYFDCKEFDCVRRKNLAMNCWDVDDVQCRSHSEYFDRLKKEFETKLEACKFCAYYQKTTVVNHRFWPNSEVPVKNR